MKIGVSSYSYSNLVNSGKMKQIEVIGKAKEMGFDVIEFADLTVPEGETLKSFAKGLKDECERVGIEASHYTVYADFINCPGGNWKEEAERLREHVEVAAVLGVPGMRHDATGGFPDGYKGQRSFDDALGIIAKGCRAVTEYAQELGIKTMVENHGMFCQDSERVEKLVNEVNHENFGALVDIGNFLCVDENPGKAVGRMMPYAMHVHIKDFHVKPGNGFDPGQGWFQSRGGNYLRGAVVGHGDVPVAQCLRIIKKAGFDGVLSIEFEGIEDPIVGISIGLSNLKKTIEKIV